MLLCDLINDVGQWLLDMGVLDIPLLGDVVVSVLSWLLSLLGCPV